MEQVIPGRSSKYPFKHFHIITPSVELGDAVSNDVLGMCNALQVAGFRATPYAESISPELRRRVRPLTKFPVLDTRDDGAVLIYHHSIDWEIGADVFTRSRAYRVIKYHNITPAEFFSPYSNAFAMVCEGGRRQISALIKEGADMYLGDSTFNLQEFIEAGADSARAMVVPPFHHAEDLQKIQPLVDEIETFLDGYINILFVGRFVPNKGHLNLLRTFAYFQTCIEPKSRLILVGKPHEALQAYWAQIRACIADLGLANRVVIVPNAPQEQLRAIYLTAHIFLCLSEHEGFCVPIIESMLNKIPVVALATTAVPETLGPDAFISEDMDEAFLSEMIAYLLEEKRVTRWLTDRQYERYWTYFSNQVIQQRFLSSISNLVAQ